MSGRDLDKGGAGTLNLATLQPPPVNVATAASFSSAADTETHYEASSLILDKSQSNIDVESRLSGEANIVQATPLEQEKTKSLNKKLTDKSQYESPPSTITAAIQRDTLNLQPPASGEFSDPSSIARPTDYRSRPINFISAETTVDGSTEYQQLFSAFHNTYLQTPTESSILQPTSENLISHATSNRPPSDTKPSDITSGCIEQEPHLSNLAVDDSKLQRNKCDTDTCEKSTRQFNFLEYDKDNEEEDDDDIIPLSSNRNEFISFDEDNDQLLAEYDSNHLRGLQRRRKVTFHSSSSPQTISFPKRLFIQIYGKLFGSSGSQHSSDTRFNPSYTSSESEEFLSEKRKHRFLSRRRRAFGKTFRGGYRYSRSEISMAIMRKLFLMLFQRSTLALFGAFLIHITLGTVYTLSNVNSYMTSYMRLNGSPNATYGGAVWISSLCAVGQGSAMVLGGLLEKRFSARMSCFLGCALHSLSIASTSMSINYGPLAVLLTYGLLPGLGIGLAYMTPMTNGFGWFPNRRGLVAGVILAGFGIGTFVFNMVQTAFVNPKNLSPPLDAESYFTQKEIIDRVPDLFIFMGCAYAVLQFIGCCLIFKPPNSYDTLKDDRPILVEQNLTVREAIRRREFIILFAIYGIITQGVLFVNAMIKEYGQLFIGNDMYLAWVGSMSSIANASGRLTWGIAIDRFSFSQCFTATTILFGSLMFLMPFEFILSSKLLYLLCTLGLFGSFSGWMSIFPVHVSRVFGRANSGVIYGLVFTAQSIGGIISAIGNHYLIDNFSRFVPFFCHVLLDIVGLAIFHLFYPK